MSTGKESPQKKQVNEGSGEKSLEELFSFPIELILNTVLEGRRAKGMDTKSVGGRSQGDNFKPSCSGPAVSWRVILGKEERTCSVGSDLIGAEPLVP